MSSFRVSTPIWAGCSGVIMQQYAETFYKSFAWQQCRDSYARSVGYLCEECGAAGEIVHHIKHITPDNINDPNITLGFDNLQLLCRDCHAKKHKKNNRRYRVDSAGRVVAD